MITFQERHSKANSRPFPHTKGENYAVIKDGATVGSILRTGVMSDPKDDPYRLYEAQGDSHRRIDGEEYATLEAAQEAARRRWA